MSRNFTRGLQSTARTLIHYVGGSNPSDVIAMNGAQGPEFGLATTNILSAIEKADPRITNAHIQYDHASPTDSTDLLTHIRGTLADPSSKDRNDPHKVITVGLLTTAGTRVATVHVHQDGTFKFWANRCGKEKGVDQKILQARIPGHLQSLDNDLSSGSGQNS